MPKVERLARVERRAAGGAVLDSVRYLHEDRIYGKHVTGIIDHRGERIATFAYDSAARVTRSELAGGAEVNTFAYGMAGAARVRSVTNELGQRHDYTFGELSSTRREYQLNSVAALATATRPASSTTLAYSGHSFLASATDAEGRLVTMTRDVRGRPITVFEASGTPDQRTTTIAWHPSFNVPTSITTERLTETRSYDAQRSLLLSL